MLCKSNEDFSLEILTHAAFNLALHLVRWSVKSFIKSGWVLKYLICYGKERSCLGQDKKVQFTKACQMFYLEWYRESMNYSY